jgi:hypothetical protein
MRGTVLFATDPATRAFLADLIHVRRSLETVYGKVEAAVAER